MKGMLTRLLVCGIALAFIQIAGAQSSQQWEIISPLTTHSNLTAVAYGNGVFVAGGGSFGRPVGTLIYSSDGGANWSPGKKNDSEIRTIAFGNGRFVAAGSRNSTVSSNIFTSIDGKRWASVTLPVPQTIAFGNTVYYAAAFGAGRFVIVG